MNQGVWGWSSVIVGTILVGVGGSLATLGWNKIRSYDQWRNTIAGVVSEVELNDRMIEAATAMIGRWTKRAQGENFSYESYHSSHVTAVVTSGLLSTKGADDREVLKTLDGYQQAISQFNAALRIVGRLNPGIFIKPDLIHTTDSNAWPAKMEDALAEPFHNLLVAHKAAKQMLDQSYPWATHSERRARVRANSFAEVSAVE